MTHRFLIILILFLIVAAVQPKTGFAQDDFLLGAPRKDNPKSSAAEEVYRQLPPDEQLRLLDEMEFIYAECQKKKMFSGLHDCQCVAMAFLDERILNYDPLRTPASVANGVARQCPSEENAAGYAFTECQRTYRSQMPKGLEPFCTCYANTFARLYIKNPEAHISNLTGIGSSALLTCSDQHELNPLRSDYSLHGREF